MLNILSFRKLIWEWFFSFIVFLLWVNWIISFSIISEPFQNEGMDKGRNVNLRWMLCNIVDSGWEYITTELNTMRVVRSSSTSTPSLCLNITFIFSMTCCYNVYGWRIILCFPVSRFSVSDNCWPFTSVISPPGFWISSRLFGKNEMTVLPLFSQERAGT